MKNLIVLLDNKPIRGALDFSVEEGWVEIPDQEVILEKVPLDLSSPSSADSSMQDLSLPEEDVPTPTKKIYGDVSLKEIGND